MRRRRREEWISTGVMDKLQQVILDAYDDWMIGLDLTVIAVETAVSPKPHALDREGGPKSRRSRKAGHQALHPPRGRERHPYRDHSRCSVQPSRLTAFLEGTLDTMEILAALPERISAHLDRGYDSGTTPQKLAERGLLAQIFSAEGQARSAGNNQAFWVVERTNSSWSNAFKKLVWCTERRERVIDFWVAFSQR